MDIKIDNVDVVREGKHLLQCVNVVLKQSRIGIIGSNGSGKSTFVRLLNGLVLPTTGQVYVGNKTTQSHSKQIRQHVGFVFQNPDQQMVLPTVIEDVAFGLQNKGMLQEEATQTALDILNRYSLAHLKNSFVYEISGGEKQMVALLGVLVMQPDWLILDEPTTLLDYKNTNRIMKTLNNAKQRIVFVTHNLDLLENFDVVLYFRKGRLVDYGAPIDMITAYKNE